MKVPEGWKVYRLTDIADYRRGSFPQPYGLEKWFDDNGHPFVQVYDVGKSLKLKVATKSKISDLAAEQSVYAPKGTVLVTLQGSIGRVAITQYPAYVDRTLLVVRGLKKPGDIHYLAISLQELFSEEKKKAPGGTIKTITKAVLNDFKVFWPPESEQRKIARILATWDDAIATTEQLLANSEQQKKALMQQLLAGKERLPGFEGEWAEQRVKEVVKIHYGRSPKEVLFEGGKYPIIGTGGVTGSANSYLVAETAVVIGRKGTINRPSLISKPFWPIDTTFYCLPTGETEITWFYYLVCLMKLEKLNEASGVPSLSRENLNRLKIRVPAHKEQKAIADILTASDKEITLFREFLDNLIRQKKALMQQLLTGKRRVKVDKEETEAATA